MAILSRFSAILHYCDSTHFFASRCGISGDSYSPRFRQSCDSRFCAAKALTLGLPPLGDKHWHPIWESGGMEGSAGPELRAQREAVDPQAGRVCAGISWRISCWSFALLGWVEFQEESAGAPKHIPTNSPPPSISAKRSPSNNHEMIHRKSPELRNHISIADILPWGSARAICDLRFASRQVAAYPPKGCSMKMPLHSFTLNQPFAQTLFSLEHFCLDQCFAIEGKLYIQRVLEHLVWSNTSAF